MVQFHESKVGLHFLDYEIPRLIDALDRVSCRLEDKTSTGSAFDVEHVAGDLSRMADEYESGKLVPGNEVSIRLRARVAELHQAPNAINVPFSVKQYLPPRPELDGLRDEFIQAADVCGIQISASEITALFTCAALVQGLEF